MKASELKVGQRFQVIPKPESEKFTVRVCLQASSADDPLVKFGFVGNAIFWCSMGGDCDIEIVK